jgi:type IV pilus assembly protein PilN
MRVTLNLATRPFADLGPAIKRLRIGMGGLALLSILFFVGLHFIHQKAEVARARDHSLDGQIAQIAREREGYTALMQLPPNAQLLQQAGVLNNLIDQKAFSWTLAMEDLETVLPGGVQVTSLDPERQKDGHIVLHLHVVGPRDRAVDLVRNLEHSRRFLLPRIVGENAADTSQQRPGQQLAPVTAGDRVEFDVLADYNPATAEERKATHKVAAKPTAAEGRTGSAPRPLHPSPLPLNQNQGRPPYTGVSQPVQAQPVQPLNRPSNVPIAPDARFPMRARPSPGTVPNSGPNSNPTVNPNSNPSSKPNANPNPNPNPGGTQ